MDIIFLIPPDFFKYTTIIAMQINDNGIIQPKIPPNINIKAEFFTFILISNAFEIKNINKIPTTE